MTSAPDKIVVLNPDANKLWLGGLVQGHGYAQGLGSLRELPIRQRAPLTIYTDLLGPKVTQTIAHPTAASVQQGISTLVRRAETAKVPVPSRVSYLWTSEHSSSQALLQLGISAKYLGVSAEAKLDTSRSAQESSVVASFFQRMFTVSIVLPQTPADYFSDGFTKAALQQQAALGRVGPGNPPVVIGSITYGRILLYSVTSTGSASDIDGALTAAYDGGAASGKIHLTTQQQQILDNARYQVVALGGNDSDVLGLIRTHRLGDYFKGHSNPETAVPISYQMDNVVDDSAATFAETTNYNLTQCQALPNHQVVIGANVQVTEPNAYLTGPRDPAEIYGDLDLSRTAHWHQDRSNTSELRLHNVTPLNWVNSGTPGTTQTYPVYYNPTTGADGAAQYSGFALTGSMNCKLNWWEFGSDPSNEYNYQWNVHNPVYGQITVDGGSAHCDVQLVTTITKVGDITEWQP
jgi:hypothetical protein